MPGKLSDAEEKEIEVLLQRTSDVDVVDRLDDWSREEFLPSVISQFNRTRWLSEKQINRLKKIVNDPEEGEDDSGSDRAHRRRFSRPSKLSYTPVKADRPSGGGFSGFGRKSDED